MSLRFRQAYSQYVYSETIVSQARQPSLGKARISHAQLFTYLRQLFTYFRPFSAATQAEPDAKVKLVFFDCFCPLVVAIRFAHYALTSSDSRPTTI
jgi:predicted GNAT superfamily acetyltransferase